MYFPDLTIRARSINFRRWMRRCKPLMNETLSTDSSSEEKAFSREKCGLLPITWESRGTVNDINIKRTTGDCNSELP